MYITLRIGWFQLILSEDWTSKPSGQSPFRVLAIEMGFTSDSVYLGLGVLGLFGAVELG